MKPCVLDITILDRLYEKTVSGEYVWVYSQDNALIAIKTKEIQCCITYDHECGLFKLNFNDNILVSVYSSGDLDLYQMIKVLYDTAQLNSLNIDTMLNNSRLEDI